jgi:hypothetical protein
MKTFALSLIASASAASVQTEKSKSVMLVETLQKKYPNATIMLRKGHGDDAWDEYLRKHNQQDPSGVMGYGVDGTVSAPGLKVGSLDKLAAGKELMPGPVAQFARTMKGQCNKMLPQGKPYHGSLAEPYHSDFMQGWGLTAVIEQTYGHLIISDELILITEACTNVRKQVALYGVAEAQCCEAATDLCCAAHYNYEALRNQVGLRYAYVCQGLTGFPYGKVEVTKEQCVHPFAKAEWQTPPKGSGRGETQSMGKKEAEEA